MINSDPDSQPSTRAAFELESFPDFLNDGWMLALDTDRILVGWRGPQVLGNSSCAIYAPTFYSNGPVEARFANHWDVMERRRFTSLVLAGVHGIVNSNIGLKDQQFQWLEPDLADFTEQWKSLREGMRERGLVKGVPVVFARAQARFDSTRLARTLKSLANLPGASYLYGFWSQTADRTMGLVGATPEILFSKTSASPAIETVALAGTRAKASGADAAEQLLRDPKERYEHQLVVDDVKAQMSKLGDVAIGTTEILELPTLYHLKTRVQSMPRDEQDFASLTKLLHPTPALGVSPRLLGFAEMRRWETPAFDRSRFGAPFGAAWEEDGVSRFHCVVAIRNIQWQDDEILLGSGCGVVGESQLEREWDELKLKRESVKRMLDL